MTREDKRPEREVRGVCSYCGVALYGDGDIAIEVVHWDRQIKRATTLICLACILGTQLWRRAAERLGLRDVPASTRTWIETFRGRELRRRAKRDAENRGNAG